ncbi:MAG: hypothetical protein ABL962_09950 [Fimbriimonadaceae bacterium]
MDKGALAAAVRQFNADFDRATMSWSAQAAFDRGSFATLLGVQVDDKRGATILGIGDSLAVLADGEEVRETFPYSSPEQFQAHPLLLSTILERNGTLLEQQPITRWSFEGMTAPRILCMTDALGAWLLTDRAGRLPILLALTSRFEFEALVVGERSQATMRRDDTSLLILG